MAPSNRPASPFRIDEPNEPTKAVVLLFGWLGAKPAHLQKYGQMWRARNCSTVAGTLNEFAILAKGDPAIDAFVLQAIREVIPLLRANDRLPLILHGFSHGGSMPIERLETLLVLTLATSAMDPDLKMVQQRLKLGAEMFDSAPIRMTLGIGVRSIRGVVPNHFLFFLAVLVSVSLYYCDRLINWFFGRPDKPSTYWSHMKTSTVCMRQAYVYSTADTITPYKHLEDMIEARRNRGADVTIRKFHDSPHVQHLRFHPTEYGQLMDVMLLKVEEYK
jgi:hypothetical protein